MREFTAGDESVVTALLGAATLLEIGDYLGEIHTGAGEFLHEDGEHVRTPPAQALEVILRRVVGRGNAAHPTLHGLLRGAGEAGLLSGS